uniref:DNA-directed RNA polymerase RBP11-like dimerisation domain-containing protein n=1 Tax=Chelydra serpentina TaxID=8475 RepID=A0A8C3SL46_CHESE
MIPVRALSSLTVKTSKEGESTTSLGNPFQCFTTLFGFGSGQPSEVEFCGYSITHPSESKINFRIQTRGGLLAIEPFRRGLTELVDVCQHVLSKFEVRSLLHAPKAHRLPSPPFGLPRASSLFKQEPQLH